MLVIAAASLITLLLTGVPAAYIVVRRRSRSAARTVSNAVTPRPVKGGQPATWPTTTRTAAASGVGYLTAISVGQHSGYDRVVFTFSQGIPGYTVGYVNEAARRLG
jgi:hypothetical protein